MYANHEYAIYLMCSLFYMIYKYVKMCPKYAQERIVQLGDSKNLRSKLHPYENTYSI